MLKQWQKCHESFWHCFCHTCGLLSSQILLSVSCFELHCNNTTFMCTCKEKEKSYMCLISVLWCFDVKQTRGWCLDEQRGCRIPHRISRLSFSAKRSRCLRTDLELVQDSTWIQRSPVNPLSLCMHFKKVDSGSTSLYHNCCYGHSIWTPKQKANVWLQAFCLLHLYLTVCGLFGLVVGLISILITHCLEPLLVFLFWV